MRLTFALERVARDVLPDWVYARLDQNRVENNERFEHIREAYLEIADRFSQEGIEHLVLKGFAHLPGTINPRDRMVGDIDLFCLPDTIQFAKDQLLRMGYKPLSGFDHSPSDHLPAMRRPSAWQWRGNYFDPEIPITVDLHFRFWDKRNTGLGINGLEEFWPRRVRIQCDNFEVPALELADNLAYGALHALRHLFHGTMSINNIYEIAWFLQTRAQDSHFWTGWHESHDTSLRRATAVAFRLATLWFHCRVPDAVEEELAQLPQSIERWMTQYGTSPLTIPYVPNKDALWLQLSLTDSPARTAVFFRALFPTRLPTLAAVQTQSTSEAREKQNKSAPVTYLSHVARRASHHARILPQTLWHAVKWWWSSKDLGDEFLVFLGASFFYTLGMFTYFLLFNLYLIDMGYKEDFLGILTGALSVGGIAAVLPVGFFIHRSGLRSAILTCFAVVPLISVLRAVVVSESLQVILAFLTGAFASIWAVAISPALAQLTNEKNRAFGFSVVFASGIGVGVLGGLFGGHLPAFMSRTIVLSDAAQLKRAALLATCGIMIVALWPASRLRFALESTPEKKVYPRSPFLARFLPAVAMWSLVTGSFAPFANAYFSQHLHAPVEKIGVYFSGSQFLQVVAILVAPLIFKKLGMISGIVCMQIATALALGGLATTKVAWAAALVYASYTAFQWMSEPGVYSLLMNKVSMAERTGASAMNAFVISAGQAIAAAVAGVAIARFGYPVVLKAVAAFALAAALVFRLLLGKTKPHHDSVQLISLAPAAQNTSSHN
jgi:MFS family permease